MCDFEHTDKTIIITCLDRLTLTLCFREMTQGEGVSERQRIQVHLYETAHRHGIYNMKPPIAVLGKEIIQWDFLKKCIP